ncbi:MAG: hypothetical protein J6V72_17985 [Kiritimatiellae bacterium]|nr:hypothetical protein [Kiritimatiellia bacterium]
MKRKLMGMVVLCFAATFLSAAWSPVAISLLPSVQWPTADADITGLRLNVLVGKHHNVYGVDVATIGNVVSNCTAGIQLAGYINLSDTVYGCQLAPYCNCAAELSGFQVGPLNLVADELSGFQIGAFNFSVGWKEAELSGFQIGALNGADKLSGFQIGGVFNIAKQKMAGFQIGIVNIAKELSGFQVGVFNYAEKANGLQVGVLNDIDDATCRFLPLLNMQF